MPVLDVFTTFACSLFSLKELISRTRNPLTTQHSKSKSNVMGTLGSNSPGMFITVEDTTLQPSGFEQLHYIFLVLLTFLCLFERVL